MSVLLETSVKLSAILLTALAAAAILHGRSAALRHWVLALGIAGAAAVPLLEPALPAWQIGLQPPSTAGGGSIEASWDLAVPSEVRSGTSASPLPAAAATGWRHWPLRSVWAAGGLASLGLLLIGYARLTWIWGRARPVDRGPWADALQTCAAELGVRRAVSLRLADHLALLVTWGVLRPRILLPRDALSWDDETIGIVLRHELAHIRRADWLVQMIAAGVQCFQWFNPVAWAVVRQLRIESEHACDDTVLAAGVDGRDYADRLVRIARITPSRAWIPAPAIARPSSLERRVRAMLNSRLNRAPLSGYVRWGTVVASVLLIAIVAAAQSGARVSGTVADSIGSFIPGATVTLTNVQTQARHEIRTNEVGFYEFVPLPDGDYRLDARLLGFSPHEERIALVGQNVQREIRLQVGTIQETVTIVGGAAPRPPSARGSYDRSRYDKALKECQPSAAGGAIRPPAKLKDVKPDYPGHLQGAGIAGVVHLRATIGADGMVTIVDTVDTPHPDLAAAAAAAVSKWEFEPTLMNCTPIDVQMNVTLNFKAAQ